MTTSSDSPSGETPRRRWFRIVLLGITVLVTVMLLFCLGELYLIHRARQMAVAYEQFAKKELIWRIGVEAYHDKFWENEKPWTSYKPNLDVVTPTERREFRFQTDAHGFRTAAVAHPKPEAVLRILCVGGSTTVEGWNNDSTYPAILQRQLKADCPGLRVEVINAGVSGDGSAALAVRMDRYLAYEPDIVIHYNGINDLVWRHLPDAFSDMPWYQRALARSRLMRRLLPELTSPSPQAVARHYNEETFPRYQAFVEAWTTRGVAVVFCPFLLPEPKQLSAAELGLLNANLESFWRLPYVSLAQLRGHADTYDRMLQTFCETSAAVYMALPSSANGFTDFVDICHMTPQGIEGKARAVAAGLKAQQLLRCPND